MALPVRLELPVTVTPAQSVRALRELISEAGWNWRRTESSRMVDRFAIIMPLVSRAKTMGLVIESGPLSGLSLECWSHVSGSSGAIQWAAWSIPPGISNKDWRPLLLHWVARLPRAPWRWTFLERSRIGFLLPVFGRSKRRFAKMNIPIGKGSWPPQLSEEWPNEMGIFQEEE